MSGWKDRRGLGFEAMVGVVGGGVKYGFWVIR